LAGVRDALKALDDAVRASKNTDAEEEIAQGALRRQYEHNYTAAHQDLWKRDLSPDPPAPYHAWLKQ